jgi:hypothetical protein
MCVALLDERLREQFRKNTNIILRGYGCSYAAMWKRMLFDEKKAYVKIRKSTNVIPEICKASLRLDTIINEDMRKIRECSQRMTE